MRTTVDTFVSEYMTAIEDRNERIKAFNQMASHELRRRSARCCSPRRRWSATIRADPARSEKITATIKTNAQRLVVARSEPATRHPLEQPSRRSERAGR
jgi:hypothetical protein